MHREGPGRSHHMSGGQGVRVSTFPCAIHPAALPSYSEKGGGGKGRFIFAKVSFFPAKKKTWRMEEGGKEKETEKSPFLFLLHPIPGSLNGFFPLPSSSLFFFPVRTRSRGVFSPSSFLERSTATESVFRIGMVSQSRIGSWDFRMRTSNVGPRQKVF